MPHLPAATRAARAAQFREMARAVGLHRVLEFGAAQPNANAGQDYDKVFVVASPWNILSLEVWYPSSRAPYLKVTHGRGISARCKEALDGFARRFEQSGAKVAIQATYVSIHAEVQIALAGLRECLDGMPGEIQAVRVQHRHADASRAPEAAPAIRLLVQEASAESGRRSGSSEAALRELIAAPAVFAERLGNAELLSRLRSFSTPFRGTLFGHHSVAEVSKVLEVRRLDVLILGANPNADHASPGAPHGTLEEQLRSGYFGEAYFDSHRRPRPGWSPQLDHKLGWRTLFRAIEGAGFKLDAVTMANYLPWSSSRLDEFLRTLDTALAAQIVQFANGQLERMLKLFRPKVLIAVRSISETRGLASSVPAQWKAMASPVSLSVATKAGGVKPVNMFKNVFPSSVPGLVLHVRHPGYLRLSRDAAVSYEKELSELMSPGR